MKYYIYADARHLPPITHHVSLLTPPPCPKIVQKKFKKLLTAACASAKLTSHTVKEQH